MKDIQSTLILVHKKYCIHQTQETHSDRCTEVNSQRPTRHLGLLRMQSMLLSATTHPLYPWTNKALNWRSEKHSLSIGLKLTVLSQV